MRSKITLYEFHYDYVLPNFGESAKLLYTDTDSLIYDFKCDDIYEYMKRDSDRFDTSDYPENNVYGVLRKNKKVLGKMKDENCGQIMEEFVGLRSKMYALKVQDKQVKRAKGVKTSVIAKKITLQDYKDCLFGEKTISREQNCIRSKFHRVYSVCETKIALNPFDDKRFIIQNCTDTLPWGHKDIMLQ